MAHTDRSRFTPRPTVYRGIQMRSRLEATYAAEIDAILPFWSYEPECFADVTGQYLPDFYEWVFPDHPEVGTYVEVKPFAPPGPATEAVQRKMEIIWSSKPDAHLIIWTPVGRWSICPPGDGHSSFKGWNWQPVEGDA